VAVAGTAVDVGIRGVGVDVGKPLVGDGVEGGLVGSPPGLSTVKGITSTLLSVEPAEPSFECMRKRRRCRPFSRRVVSSVNWPEKWPVPSSNRIPVIPAWKLASSKTS
jgi:hypothetical protein